MRKYVDRNKIGKCKVKNDCLRDVSERQSAYPLQVRDVEMSSACVMEPHDELK